MSDGRVEDMEVDVREDHKGGKTPEDINNMKVTENRQDLQSRSPVSPGTCAEKVEDDGCGSGKSDSENHIVNNICESWEKHGAEDSMKHIGETKSLEEDKREIEGENLESSDGPNVRVECSEKPVSTNEKENCKVSYSERDKDKESENEISAAHADKDNIIVSDETRNTSPVAVDSTAGEKTRIAEASPMEIDSDETEKTNVAENSSVEKVSELDIEMTERDGLDGDSDQLSQSSTEKSKDVDPLKETESTESDGSGRITGKSKEDSVANHISISDGEKSESDANYFGNSSQNSFDNNVSVVRSDDEKADDKSESRKEKAVDEIEGQEQMEVEVERSSLNNDKHNDSVNRGASASKGKADDDDIVELDMPPKPAEVVDLAGDETDANKGSPATGKNNSGDESNSDGIKRIKLRSLASLVDDKSNDATSCESVSPAPVSSGHIEPPAIGDIVEHGDIIGSDEMGGLQLRISNVVGGEDCITGLSVDEDRDAFSNIQISSVTTLMDPMSPEDPNQGKDCDGTEKPLENENDRIDGDDSAIEKSGRSSTEMQNRLSYSAGTDQIKIVNSESLSSGVSSTESDANKRQGSEPPKIRLSSAVSAVAKDTGTDDTCPPKVIYHILRSVLTVNRCCISCKKNVQCEFRATKKSDKSCVGFICTSDCRTRWTSSLPSDSAVERPRLIFEKLCGMCGKDLSNLPRNGQFSWETREFCSQRCLTSHLREVAGECHTCLKKVQPFYIGKYCVRFGSDIHQFCSNHCLERYKTKIKVCCYCQKNLEKVDKVTSVANKEYCSVKCLKRAQRRDIGQQNYSEHHPCTVCQALGINRYEFLLNAESQQLCSDPCLNVYKYANKVKSVSCCLCFRVLNAEDVSHYLYHGGHQLRVFCSDSCVNVFILSARKIVICDACKVKKYNFDMVHRQVDEDYKEFYYCSLNCLNATDAATGRITAVTAANSGSGISASGGEAPIAPCNMCNDIAKSQYHMVMSDNTLRSFCRYQCATKYKTTYGYQVEGVQSNATTAGTLRMIRSKSPSQTVDSTIQNKKNSTKETGPDIAAMTLELLKVLNPPAMANKMTSCRPNQSTKGVYCKPHPWHRTTQTDVKGIDSDISGSTEEKPHIVTEDGKMPPILPVPIPVYVPTPMMMYNAPFPVPMFVPLPVPVPIFIPTTEKTTANIKDAMEKIREEFPEDPYEAEMLLLARANSEKDKGCETESTSPQPATAEDHDGEDEVVPEELVETVDHEAASDDLNSTDLSFLNSLEEDLPRYTLRLNNEKGDAFEPDSFNENRGKRPSESSELSERPRKRRRANSDDSDSMYDPDDPVPELEPEPDPIMDDEFQGPYLNKVYGIAAWKHWVTEKNAELAGVSSSRTMKLISEDFLAMNCEELNYALCLFLKDLRKPNGEPFQPDTIFYLLLGIQQHLFESGRTDCIFMDFGFERFTNSLDEITKNFLANSTSPVLSPTSSLGITRITESMLWECRQLGAHTPQVLLNTLFYFNTKVFKLRTIEDHQALSFVQIFKQWRRQTVVRDGSVTRTTLLKYYPKKSATDGVTRNYEMHENREDALRCPVKLYEFYLSKCPESVRNQRNTYYVYPERSCVPDSPVWFSTQAVQSSNLSKMLNRVLMVREVQESLYSYS